MQQASEQMVEENKLSEGQLLQILRSEVEAAEKQLEEERAAHAETRKAGAVREQEMDAALAGAGAALGPLQRQIEDKSARLSAAEERVAGLEAELDESGRQLQAAQSQLQRAKEAAAAASSDAMTARIEAAEAAVVEAKAAEQKAQVEAQTAAAEVTRLTQQVTELNQRLATTAASDSGDLHRRIRELSDMLMLKQSQLERLAADSAAQRLSLERQVQSAKTEAQKALRRRPSFLASSSSSATDRAMMMMMGEERGGGDMMVSMETLPAYNRLAGDKRVGGAVKAGAKLLDATTNQAVYMLVRYPIWRLGLFLYIIGMHLFVYFLLHRLQHKAFLAHEALIDSEHRALG
jgi:chromosome segregation ATPase